MPTEPLVYSQPAEDATDLTWYEDLALSIPAFGLGAGAAALAFPVSGPVGSILAGGATTSLAHTGLKRAYLGKNILEPETLKEAAYQAPWDIGAFALGPVARVGGQALFKTTSATPWRDVIGKGLSEAADVPIPGLGPIFGAGKQGGVPEIAASGGEGIFEPAGRRYSLKRLFQPAIERVPEQAQLQFREEAVASGLSREAGYAVAEKMFAESTAEDRMVFGLLTKAKTPNDFDYIWSKLDNASKEKFKDLQEPFQSLLELTNNKSYASTTSRRALFADKIQELYTELPTTSRAYQSFASVLERAPGLKGEKLQTTLAEMIADDELTPMARQVAKSLYYMPQDTLKGLHKAFTEAEEASLFTSLKKESSGFISTIPQAGFVKSQHPQFESTYKLVNIKGEDTLVKVPIWVDSQVEDQLRSMQFMSQTADHIYGTMQKYLMAPWKTGQIVLRAPTQMRNIFGNMITNDWGGLPFWRADVYGGAMKDIARGVPDVKLFEGLTGHNTTFAGTELQSIIRKWQIPHDTSAWGKGVVNLFEQVFFNPLSRKLGVAYRDIESFFKYAKFKHNRSLGMTPEEAAFDAVKWTHNYGEVSPATQILRSTVMPFATWTTKTLPLFAEALVKNPLRVGKWLMLPYGLTYAALQNQDVSPRDWLLARKGLPDYLTGRLTAMLPWKDREDRLQFLNTTWMIPGFGDVAEMVSQTEQGPLESANIVLQNPFLDMMATAKRGTTFTGKPLYEPWDDTHMKLYKMLTHGWSQFAPGIMGRDMLAGVETLLGRDIRAQDPYQFIASQMGLKVQPYDVNELYRRAKTRHDREKARAEQEAHAKIRFAASPEEQAKQVEKRVTNLRKVEEAYQRRGRRFEDELMGFQPSR